MKITFETDKHCSCYERLVNNGTDRLAIKEFSKHFSKDLIPAVLRVHNKLINSPNAQIFNATTTYDNKIQLKEGSRKEDPQVFKVRIQNAYRKFFYYPVETNGNYCLTKEWRGQFNEVTELHVFEINKHDYR